ncbi:MAG: hypothetical protein M3X11_01395 [Acidobacteriota bacterium]|nr:hypothetical protein [Acidobacteriota bacterium]
MPTFEEVLHEARKLKPQEKQRLTYILGQETPKTIEQIAAEQGVGPLDFDKLRELGGNWPEDEDIDEFISFVKESRQGDSYQRIARLED